MTPSLNKCPRCGTLRPSGEVAHTCVARDPADTGTSREGDPYAEIAALRADLQRKDAALKEAHEYMQKADDDLTSVLESRSPYGEERRRYEMSRNGMDYFEMARDVLDAALQPKEPPCKA